MAAALLSSLVSIRRTFICSFTSPNRLLIRISPRNFGRRISCSAADPQISPLNLGSTQPCRISSKIKTLIKSGQRAMEAQQIINKSHRDQHSPAMVSCTTVKSKNSKTNRRILHFSTFDSDGELLKYFSKPVSMRRSYYQLFSMSACRDLLLLTKEKASFLCNIATQKVVTIPCINKRGDRGPVAGFGYVPFTDKIKFLANQHPCDLGFKVLTLGNKLWRDVKDPPIDIKKIQLVGGVFVSGVIHLLAKLGDKIVTFNLEKEEWGLIVAPPIQSSSSRILKELNGLLCIVDQRFINSIDIWYLDHKDSWVKACTIYFSAWNTEHIFKIEPLAIENDGRILVQVDMHNIFSLQFYDPKNKSTREIHRLDISSDSNYFDQFYVKVSSTLGHLGH